MRTLRWYDCLGIVLVCSLLGAPWWASVIILMLVYMLLTPPVVQIYTAQPPKTEDDMPVDDYM